MSLYRLSPIPRGPIRRSDAGMCGFDTARTAAGRRIGSSLLLFALLGVSPLSAQQAQTSGNQSPAIVAGRDATVNYGPTPEQVQELTKAAAAGAVGSLAN